MLPLNVLTAHINHAFQAVAGADRRGGNAMLTCASLGDDAPLAHTSGQHRLADYVIDLVSTGVVKVFTLKEDVCATRFLTETPGVVHRRGTPNVISQFFLELGNESRIVVIALVGSLQFLNSPRQCFADEASAEATKEAFGVRLVVLGFLRHITGSVCAAVSAITVLLAMLGDSKR